MGFNSFKVKGQAVAGLTVTFDKVETNPRWRPYHYFVTGQSSQKDQ